MENPEDANNQETPDEAPEEKSADKDVEEEGEDDVIGPASKEEILGYKKPIQDSRGATYSREEYKDAIGGEHDDK